MNDDILDHFCAEAEAKGTGYQTRINAALRSAIDETRGRSKEGEPQ